MVDDFIIYIVMELVGPWLSGFIVFILFMFLLAITGMITSPSSGGGLGGCTERLPAA